MKTILAFLLLCTSALAVDYPVVYLSRPATATTNTPSTSERNGPFVHVPGDDLMLLMPDGTDKKLVEGQDDAKGLIAVIDHCVSLDGKSIFYAHVRTHTDRHGLWCDVFRYDLADGKVIQITDAKNDWTPPRGSGAWADSERLTKAPGNYPDVAYGTVWHMSPCDTPSGLIVVSTKNGIRSPGETFEAGQLFRMDHDGKYMEQIASGVDLGGSMHPTLGKDGKVYFSTAQQQTKNSHGGGWGIWKINPDGTEWEPVFSVIGEQGSQSAHLQAQTTDGSVAWTRYYDTQVEGRIDLAPPFKASPFGPPTQFGPPLKQDNKPIVGNWREGETRIRSGNFRKYAFQPRGLFSIAPWTTESDTPNGHYGNITHPAPAPGNGLLYVWTGTSTDRRLQIAVVPDVAKTKSYPEIPDYKHLVSWPKDIQKVHSPAGRHAWFPKAVVPYKTIYGHDPPNPTGAKSKLVKPGSPFTEIGTSGLNYRGITVHEKHAFGGGKMVEFDTEKIAYIRVLGFNPTTVYGFRTMAHGPEPRGGSVNGFQEIDRSEGRHSGFGNTEGFYSQITERTGILAEIPVKHWRLPDGSTYSGESPPEGATRILRSDGKPDTSWRAVIPADVSWTFQLLDKEKRVIPNTTAETWHQGRPGERRTNCQGCHAHNKPDPITFEETFAATVDYKPKRFNKLELTEYFRDVQPIFAKHGIDPGPKPWKWATRYQSANVTTDLSALTEAERLTVYRWVDTGLMVAGNWAIWNDDTKSYDLKRVKPSDQVGPYVDNVPPTLAVKVYADKLIVGAHDWQSGLNKASLSIKADVPIVGREAGAELADLFQHNAQDWTWMLSTTVPKGSLTVSIRDNQVAKDVNGNVASENGNKAKRTVALLPESEPPPPDSSDEEIARLKARIAELEQAVEDLKKSDAAKAAVIDAVKAAVN